HVWGGLFVVVVTEGVSLGIVKPPAEADIVAMEAQSFGLAPSYGGPFAGVIASRDKFVRQMPERLSGQTTDSEGRRGFVLTLATREQHIRREKATSNICTNQALCALAATVHLTLLGKEGLREMAQQNLSKAQFALAELTKIPGVRRAFDAPFFNEFTLEFPRSVKIVNTHLLRDNIIVPLALGANHRSEGVSGFPEVSEIEVLRHFTRLSTWNYAIDLGMYPLGSCTMKYNPRVNEFVARLDGIATEHPYQPQELSQGCLKIQ